MSTFAIYRDSFRNSPTAEAELKPETRKNTYSAKKNENVTRRLLSSDLTVFFRDRIDSSAVVQFLHAIVRGAISFSPVG